MSLKYHIFFALSLALSTLCTQATAQGQNLVQNPSFEEYSQCPTNPGGGTQDEIGCSSYKGTPEYFNSCACPYNSGCVPDISNGQAFQYPASGNAMVGLATYFPFSDQNNREVVGCELTSPLQIGLRYFVSFQVNLIGINPMYWMTAATDHLGVLFTTNTYNVSNPIATTNNFAHVYSTSIITDTLNWTRVSGSFIADSSYRYMALGTFFDTAHVNKLFFADCSDGSCQYAAYYFIDDLCVSTDSLYCRNYSWTERKEEIFVMPSAFTPNNDYINDIYLPVFSSSSTSIEVFRVYNRWGQIVYEIKDAIIGWDGTYNGNPQPADVYAYYIEVRRKDGRIEMHTGNFTLVR